MNYQKPRPNNNWPPHRIISSTESKPSHIEAPANSRTFNRARIENTIIWGACIASIVVINIIYDSGDYSNIPQPHNCDEMTLNDSPTSEPLAAVTTETC